MGLKVGLVGCGAIGSALARFIQRKLRPVGTLKYIFDSDLKAQDRLACSLKSRFPQLTLSELVKKSDFVIEAASIRSAREIIPLSIRYKKPTLLMSGGGLVSEGKLLKKIFHQSTKFYLPSGAIGVIDALLASREAGIQKIRITTSKSLKSLAGAPYFKQFPKKSNLKKSSEMIFEGNVLEAIRYFPKNLNVAALLALGGKGPRKTRVRVIAYKALEKNIHEIEIESKAGKIYFKTENFPHPDNPRTSALAIYSAQALLRKIFSPLSLGT